MARARRILTLGEGDFSFSLSLLSSSSSPPIHLTATSFDSLDDIRTKFGDDGIRIVEKLAKLKGVLVHSVDATRLSSYPELFGQFYDEIIFHHPHCGSEDAGRHRILLAHLFRSISGALRRPDGVVTISLADGQADRWQIIKQASLSSLILVDIKPLDADFTWRRHQGRSFRNIHRGDQAISQRSTSFSFALSTSSYARKHWSAATPPPLSAVKPFSCRSCDRRYATAQGLATHERDGHIPRSPQNVVACSHCERTFSDQSACSAHFLAKHGPDPDIKPDWFNPNSAETSSTTHDEMTLSCIACRSSFGSETAFQDHIDRLQPMPTLAVSCTICAKSFASHHSLRQHVLHCSTGS